MYISRHGVYLQLLGIFQDFEADKTVNTFNPLTVS